MGDSCFHSRSGRASSEAARGPARIVVKCPEMVEYFYYIREFDDISVQKWGEIAF